MDDYYDLFSGPISWLQFQGPIYLVWLAAIVWAALGWKRHPRKSFLVMFVLTVFLSGGLVWPFAVEFLVNRTDNGGLGVAEMRWLILQHCYSVVNALLWLLLLWAIFMVDRTPQHLRGPDGELLPPDWARSDRPGWG